MGDGPAGKGACNQALPEFDPQVSDGEKGERTSSLARSLNTVCALWHRHTHQINEEYINQVYK